jgi:hypothetical protein
MLTFRPDCYCRTSFEIVLTQESLLIRKGKRGLGPNPTLDLGFLMHRMGPATWAELLDCELLRLALLVLARSVIPPLAAVARQSD